MNVEKKQDERDTTGQRAAAEEMIELGEMLFDTVIDVAARRPVEGEEVDASLIEDIRAAADEFFMALRLLLEAGQPSHSSEVSASGFQIPAEQDKN